MNSKRETFNWKKLLDQARKYQFALLILLVGLVLLAWPSGSGGAKTAAAQSTSSVEEEPFDLEDMETRLAESLSKIQGVGRTEVVLTLAAGSEKILATDQEVTADSGQTTTVVINNGSSQETTVTTQIIYPTFQGALVVCDGGGNSTVRLNVLRAVKALTGLDANNISVCARTGGNE